MKKNYLGCYWISLQQAIFKIWRQKSFLLFCFQFLKSASNIYCCTISNLMSTYLTKKSYVLFTTSPLATFTTMALFCDILIVHSTVFHPIIAPLFSIILTAIKHAFLQQSTLITRRTITKQLTWPNRMFSFYAATILQKKIISVYMVITSHIIGILIRENNSVE